MIPQLIMIVLIWAFWIVSVIKHGEDKGEYNAYASFLSLVITMWILISGGFFKCFGW